MLAVPVTSEQAPTLAEAVRRLSAQIDALSAAGRQALEAYRAAAPEGSPLRALALTRCGDVYDAVATRIGGGGFPLPADLVDRIRAASPEVRAEVERQAAERISDTLRERAAPLWCYALESYREALAIDPASERARDQVARYGAELAARCAARH
jgi:hypothetical protein